MTLPSVSFIGQRNLCLIYVVKKKKKKFVPSYYLKPALPLDRIWGGAITSIGLLAIFLIIKTLQIDVVPKRMGHVQESRSSRVLYCIEFF